MGILKSTREFKAPGADKEHTNEVRGGGRDPGVRRPRACLCFFLFLSSSIPLLNPIFSKEVDFMAGSCPYDCGFKRVARGGSRAQWHINIYGVFGENARCV